MSTVLARAEQRVIEAAAEKVDGGYLDVRTKYIALGEWLVALRGRFGWEFFRVTDAPGEARVADEIDPATFNRAQGVL